LRGVLGYALAYRHNVKLRALLSLFAKNVRKRSGVEAYKVFE